MPVIAPIFDAVLDGLQSSPAGPATIAAGRIRPPPPCAAEDRDVVYLAAIAELDDQGIADSSPSRCRGGARSRWCSTCWSPAPRGGCPAAGLVTSAKSWVK